MSPTPRPVSEASLSTNFCAVRVFRDFPPFCYFEQLSVLMEVSSHNLIEITSSIAHPRPPRPPNKPIITR